MKQYARTFFAGLRTWRVAFWLSAAFLFISWRTDAQSQRIALLIGIGNYPAATGWPQINSPNDIDIIADALMRRGFPRENIFVLRDEAATREGILNAIQEVLIKRARPGDVMYFQFSGHGQQVADDNGDESDGYDEAIVPVNSPLRYVAGVYQGENLIRDDELGRLFAEVRSRLGPKGNLMVVVDACHSGTGTRGMEVARGTTVAMAPDDYAQKMTQRKPDDYSAPQFGEGASSTLAPMAAFFGSAHNQLNYETRDESGKRMGSLSYALSKKLTQAPINTSYRGLFEEIKLEMSAIAPNQQPQAEGMLDQEIMGGRLLEKPSFYSLTNWNDPTSVVINGGWMVGINEGSVVGFYPAETRNPASAQLIAKGTVTAAQPFSCTVRLEGPGIDQNTVTSGTLWAYVLEQNFGNLRVGLSIQLPQGNPVRTALEQKLASFPLVHQDDAPEVYLVMNGGAIQLVGRGDYVLYTASNANPDLVAKEIQQRILAFAQAKYMRQMEMRNAGQQVECEIVPVRVNRMSVEAIPLDSKRDALGNIHFQLGDQFKLRVTNKGSRAAFFTVVDIQPDNVVNVIVPDTQETPSEFRLSPGQSMETQIFQINPPAGAEIFKLIATDQAVDLRPSILKVKTRGIPPTALEKLFDELQLEEDSPVQSRGGATIGLSAGSINVFTSTFIID